MTAPAGTRYRAEPPRWEFRPGPDPEQAQELARALGLQPVLCRILVSRGVGDAGRARSFLRPRVEDLPPPGELVDLGLAAERIDRAIRRGETILVHGDYDVDGMCASALLARWIRRFGGRVETFAPHRIRDGYDLGPAGLRRAGEVGASLIVTVDCGIAAGLAVDQARAAGVDVVVTDHHAPGPALPSAVAVVNPNRRDDPSGQGGLCGAGVAFQLVRELAASRSIPLADLLPDLDLVALATVADLVPLTGPNRILVRYGIRALARTRKPGLVALMEAAGVDAARVDAGKVGFVLAPRLNAVGRLGDAADGIRLLLTEDPDEARRLAAEADRINGQRRDEDRRTLEAALAQLDSAFDPSRDYGVVLAGRDWHPGVIGIVASRVVERIHRPTVLVALGDQTGRGSARSIPGFHLHEALTRCAPHLVRYGGHAQAAGMDIRASALDGFREAFNQVAGEALADTDLRRVIHLDLETRASELTLEVAEQARYLGPHGIGNSRPTLVARGLRLAGPARVVGSGHLKLSLEADGVRLEAIGFGLAERHPPDTLAGGPLDAAFHLEVNEFRGRRTPQLKLLDLRPS